MGQKLIIVESPAKAKTIGKYLGKNYVVEASMGHVRDLPKSQLGVDISNNYEPKYITIRGKGELLDTLRRKAKKSDQVYLATDPDREGEAISWHLLKSLKLDEKDKCRIEFNEITKNAVRNAIKNPRRINTSLVNAQQARRILDRLVGYEISPILWRKVKWGLSAGRVQSVTLKMICDRQKEIEEFVPLEYWTIECKLSNGNSKDDFLVKLISHKGKKINISSEDESIKIKKALEEGVFNVHKIKKSSRKKNPLPPFTTSTLQQDAYKRINFSTKKTMSVAQTLYEGVDIKKHGTVGLITYMRTDSVRISKDAQNMAKDYVSSNFGEEYIPPQPRVYQSKKNIQDAHEAIRPTDITLEPNLIKDSLKPDQYKLYKLIWQRFVASQMASCIQDVLTVDVMNNEYLLRVSGTSIQFPGFMKIYEYKTEEEQEQNKIPHLNEGEELKSKAITNKQHFTQPLPQYTEASLVKTLEENGIGRPSTYAPIISTLLSRNYVSKNSKRLEPTELGLIVNSLLCDYFKEIVDVEFTADMEDRLDNIEAGKEEWKKVIDTFFKPIKKSIEIAEKEIAKITIEDKVSDVKCDKCGRLMVIKKGRFGDFLACPGYPECKNTKAILKEIDVNCPDCKTGKIIIRNSKKGRRFYGCSNYPDCKFVSWFEPTNEKCTECGSYMVKKSNKTKGDYLECSNKECGNKVIIKDNEKSNNNVEK